MSAASTHMDNNTTIACLSKVDNWQPIASGIWTSSIGDTSKELRYSDLAAEAPQIDRINQLPAAAFPFDNAPITYSIDANSQIMVRVPCEPDETIYGFGLQLDSVNQTGKVLNLKTDHWGHGRTHAPVPFSFSSHGYGVLQHRTLSERTQQDQQPQRSPHRPAEVDRNPPPSKSTRSRTMASAPPGDAVEATSRQTVLRSSCSLVGTEIAALQSLLRGGTCHRSGAWAWHRNHAHHDHAEVRAEVDTFAEKYVRWMSSASNRAG